MKERIQGLFFSPTKTTKKIIEKITETMGEVWRKEPQYYDFTLPSAREATPIPIFGQGDMIIVGVPVYGGRVPEVAARYLKKLDGRGAQAVAVAVYGNRDYDDALLELADLLESVGFFVIAGGAFIGEHSFTKNVAANRPDQRDAAIARSFALQVIDKIKKSEPQSLSLPGNRPYKAPMAAAGFLPKTSDACIACKKCARHCPLGLIDMEDPSRVASGCLGCCACVKGCPKGAKYFDSEVFLRFRTMLEEHCSQRQEPELFLS